MVMEAIRSRATGSVGKQTIDLVDRVLLERLLTLPRYRQVPSATMARLIACGKRRTLTAGQAILVAGHSTSSFFLVLGGRFKMWRRLEHGRKALVALFQFGDPVGISAIGGRRNETTVEALESSICLQIPFHAFMTLIERNPRLIGDLLPPLMERVQECNNCLIEGTFLRVEQRLARILLKLGRAAGRSHPDGLLVPIPLSRQDLADMAGTSLETTIRRMSKWSKLGIVETRRDGFLLRDSARLKNLSHR